MCISNKIKFYLALNKQHIFHFHGLYLERTVYILYFPHKRYFSFYMYAQQFFSKFLKAVLVSYPIDLHCFIHIKNKKCLHTHRRGRLLVSLSSNSFLLSVNRTHISWGTHAIKFKWDRTWLLTQDVCNCSQSNRV